MSDLPTPPTAASAEEEATPLFHREGAPDTPARPVATPGYEEAALELPVTPGPVEPLVPSLPEEPAAEPARLPAATVAEIRPSATAPHFRTDHCPRCGYADFGAGTVIAYNGGFHPAYFKPARLTFRHLSWMWRPFRAIVELEAQVCRQCGLVMLQVNTDRLRQVEKRSGDRE